MKHLMKSLVLSLSCLTSSVAAETPDAYVAGFPHVYEFDSSLNPNGNYWCGHAVLDSVLTQLGQQTDIKQLHELFLRNSPGGYAKNTYCSGSNNYCAKLQDLMWGAESFGMTAANGELERTSASLLQKVKDAVQWERAVIVPSNYKYNTAGHFWLIVGYKENPDNIDHSVLFLRDVARDSAAGTHWDEEVLIGSFVYHTNFGGKIPYLIIKD